MIDYWYVIVEQERHPAVVYVYENVKHVLSEGRLISLTPVEEVVAEKREEEPVKRLKEGKGRSALLYVYFDFDKYKLRKNQKEKIGRALEEGLLSQKGWYVVVGHADWIGSKRYNLNLSRKRAEEVGKHLKSLGVENVELSWKGEEECDLYKGRRVSRDLIKALQPCRKVEIWPKD
ncbi:MAG: OmpA family protein [Thermocrinis sp.]|uniref:OmpA family protein n=1 Tax=Thermocrinis sp. TaxID=2024383 RepID=UPI003C01F7EB